MNRNTYNFETLKNETDFLFFPCFFNLDYRYEKKNIQAAFNRRKLDFKIKIEPGIYQTMSGLVVTRAQ